MTRSDPAAASLPPVTFTPEQAAAVVLALATRPDGPYAVDGRAALERVLDALDPERRERAVQLAERVAAGSRRSAGAGVRGTVDRGLRERRVLVLGYRDGAGRTTRRRVEPGLLVGTGEHEYLVAWCLERAGVRWFRHDRIEDAVLTGETVADRDPALFGAPPSAVGRSRPRHSAAHPAGRARRAAPGAPARAARAEEGLAPVVHLRSVR